jgi:hypothetical protein
MKRTMMSWMLVATVFATTAAACGSDDEDKTPTTEAAETDSTEASGDEGDGGSAEVDAYCTQAEELGQQLKDAMANPTGADVAAITADAQELTAAAAALATANPDDAARITECSQLLAP